MAKRPGSIILRVLLFLSLIIIVCGITLTFTILMPTSSQKTVVIPDVREMPSIKARSILNKIWLRVKESYQSHPQPKNWVVEQIPAPGQRVKRGRKVELIVSSGSALVSTPAVQGLSLIEARNKARNHHLIPGDIAYIYSSEVEKDFVISQTPLANSKVPEGSKANLLVSQGPGAISFYMPELIGMKLDEAIEMAKKVGLKPVKVTEEVVSGVEKGTVITHQPLPRYRVERGMLLNLVVAAPPSPQPQNY